MYVSITYKICFFPFTQKWLKESIMSKNEDNNIKRCRNSDFSSDFTYVSNFYLAQSFSPLTCCEVLWNNHGINVSGTKHFWSPSWPISNTLTVPYRQATHLNSMQSRCGAKCLQQFILKQWQFHMFAGGNNVVFVAAFERNSIYQATTLFEFITVCSTIRVGW